MSGKPVRRSRLGRTWQEFGREGRQAPGRNPPCSSCDGNRHEAETGGGRCHDQRVGDAGFSEFELDLFVRGSWEAVRLPCLAIGGVVARARLEEKCGECRRPGGRVRRADADARAQPYQRSLYREVLAGRGGSGGAVRRSPA